MRHWCPRSILVLTALSMPLAAQAKAEAKDAAQQDDPKVVSLVRMSGAYADLAEQGFDFAAVMTGGGGQVKAFYELTEKLDDLASSKASDVVLLDLSRSVGLNLPQLAEVARCLAKVRKAGKKTYAYLENAGRAQYQIASQCDEVMLADMGSIDLGSLSMSSLFMRDAMDLLGVQADVLRCGDFKGATEPLTRSRMSDHLRRHYLDMLGSMNDDLVGRIARGRGMKPERVRELQGQRLITAKEALVAGLVDRLVPWEGAKRSLQTRLGEDVKLKDALKGRKKRGGFNIMAMMQNMLRPKDEVEVEDEKTLAVLHLSGAISDGTTALPGSIVSGPAVRTIRQLAENDNVSGVVVRINSPGGSATASEAIVLALAELAKQKPVVCSMGDLAASGGYYVTCFGRPILAEAGTITGSIGVFGLKLNMGALMRRIGIHQELIALDEGSSLDAIDRGFSDRDRVTMQRHMNEIYDRFLDHVAKSRGMARADVEAIAGGRVWSGSQAVANKLVDRIGGLEDALAMVAAEAELEVDDYEVVHMPRPRSFMDTFAAQMMDMRVFGAGLSAAVLRRVGGLRTVCTVLHDALTNDRPTMVWAMLPAELRIR